MLRGIRFCANEKPYIYETFFTHPRQTKVSEVIGNIRGIGNNILLLLQRNGIDLSKCRAQAHDGTSALSSEASGAVSVIKKEQR